MASQSRRTILKKMGAASISLGTITVAGCLGGNGEEDEWESLREVEEDISEDRRVDNTLIHLSQTEEYDPDRYQTNRLVTEQANEILGVNYELDPVENTVLEEREQQGEWDFITYGWWSEQGGDPDNVINFRFHTDGQRNFGNYSNSEYDELAEESQSEYDRETRQEQVYRLQEMLGELRWENQYLYKENLHPYNTNLVNEESVIIDGRKMGTWVTWTNLEPGPENDEGVVVTNNWDPTSQVNPFDQITLGPSRNLTPMLLINDTFIRFDENYEPVMWLANDIENIDDTTIRVTIRNDFEFHDGQPVTIDDVLWTYNTILETEPPAHLTSVVNRLESVEQTGDSEVTFHLTEPYVPFTTLTFWRTPILPSHYWEEILAEAGAEDQPWEITFNDNRPLIGSGPFEYGSWNPGERFELIANKDHPIAPPSIEARVQRPLASTAAEQEALVQGDYGLLDYWLGSNTEMDSTIEEQDHLERGIAVENLRESTWVNTDTSPLDDIVFRQAYNAIVADLQNVFINEVYGGYGIRGHSPISEIVEFWHNPEVPWFDGGAETAIELLNDAGYRWDEDGNLYYPENNS